MEEWAQTTEVSIRLGAFLAVLIGMAAWEVLLPRRSLVARKPGRWASNLSLVVLNSGLARVLVPITAITAVAAAIFAESRGWGLLHLVEWPFWLEIVLAVAAFDLAIYLQHVMFHAVPLFWRLHMVHHADLDFDVTTGLRFHTLEILLSALIKLAVVLVLGPPAVAVIAFEVLLNATSMFNHSNVKMPDWLDRLLRWFVVTPRHAPGPPLDHPSRNEQQLRLQSAVVGLPLGTYRPQPQEGHERMRIGLTTFPDEQQVDRLPGMLLLPFRRQKPASMMEDASAEPPAQEKPGIKSPESKPPFTHTLS